MWLKHVETMVFTPCVFHKFVHMVLKKLTVNICKPILELWTCSPKGNEQVQHLSIETPSSHRGWYRKKLDVDLPIHMANHIDIDPSYIYI